MKKSVIDKMSREDQLNKRRDIWLQQLNDYTPDYLKHLLLKYDERVRQQVVDDVMYKYPALILTLEELITIIYGVIIRHTIYRYMYYGDSIEMNEETFTLEINDGCFNIDIKDSVVYNYLINRLKSYLKTMMMKQGTNLIYELKITNFENVEKFVINI